MRFQVKELIEDVSLETETMDLRSSGFEAVINTMLDALKTEDINRAEIHHSPIRIIELNTVRNYFKASSVIMLNGVTYPNGFHCLMKHTLMVWQKSGSIPEGILPTLLKLIECSFYMLTCGGLQKFNKTLKDLQTLLDDAKKEDVYFFYATPIKTEEGDRFLLEILLDIQQKGFILTKELLIIAKWIWEQDPSLLGKCPELSNLYETLQAGSYFKKPQLLKCIQKLHASATYSSLRNALTNLQLSLESTDVIKESQINELKKIYGLRWQLIMDGPEDYLRIDPRNDPWIFLARMLAGAALIEPDYYRLLIPSLSHSTDSVSGEPLTLYPLSNYVLSECGKKLICLPVCVSQHEACGTFYNCANTKPKVLTPKEIQRLKFADNRFWDYYQRLTKPYTDPVISRKTVKKLKTLVNDSLFDSGLAYGNNYSNEQMISTTHAYDKFFEYAGTLSEDEWLNLSQQRIFYKESQKTFGEVMNDVQRLGRCSALSGLFFAKLVVDYDPLIKFSAEIESKININEMRMCSARKTYSDPQISQEEAQRRLLIMMVSLIQHKFSNFFFSGDIISLWNYENKVTSTGKRIFDEIMPVIINDNYKHAQHTYSRIMKTIIKPAINNKSYSDAVRRTTDTQLWLSSIENRSLFNHEYARYFMPELFVLTWPLMIAENIFYKEFMIEIINLLARSNNFSEVWLIGNIKFSVFLQGFDNVNQITILKILRANEEKFSVLNVVKSATDFIIYQLSLLPFLSSETRIHFWDRQSNVGVINKINVELEKANRPENISGGIMQLLDVVNMKKFSSQEKKLMLEYMQSFKLSESIQSTAKLVC